MIRRTQIDSWQTEHFQLQRHLHGTVYHTMSATAKVLPTFYLNLRLTSLTLHFMTVMCIGLYLCILYGASEPWTGGALVSGRYDDMLYDINYSSTK